MTTIELRPWQREFIEKIKRSLRENRRGELLADDMGLGKTYQSLFSVIHVCRAYEKKLRQFRTLIVVPSSVVTQWYEKASDIFAAKYLHVCRSADGMNIATAIENIPDNVPIIIVPYSVMVASYKNLGTQEIHALHGRKTAYDCLINSRTDAARELNERAYRKWDKFCDETCDPANNVVNKLSLTKWDMVIIDEAHELRNGLDLKLKGKARANVNHRAMDEVVAGGSLGPPKRFNGHVPQIKGKKDIKAPKHTRSSNRYLVSFEAICLLQRRFTLLLTGTPLQNKLSDWISLARVLNVPHYNRVVPWVNDFYAICQFDFGGTDGSRVEIPIMRDFRNTYFTRRLATDLLKLPPKRVTNIEMDMNPFEHRELGSLAQMLIEFKAEKEELDKSTGITKKERAERVKSILGKILSILQRMRMFCCTPHIIPQNIASTLRKLKGIVKMHEEGVTVHKNTLKESEGMRGITWENEMSKKIATLQGKIEESTEVIEELELAHDYWQEVVDRNPEQSTRTTQILELLEGILTNPECAGQKILVFSEFSSYLKYLQPIIKAKFAHLMGEPQLFTGTTPPAGRDIIVHRFKKVDSCRVMLMGIKCGSVGLNLTEANHVIIAEPNYNPSLLSQAEARAWRYGQDKTVHVTKLKAKLTVEEWMQGLGTSKLWLAEDTMLDGSAVRTFTDDNAEEKLARVADAIIQSMWMHYVRQKSTEAKEAVLDTEEPATASAEKRPRPDPVTENAEKEDSPFWDFLFGGSGTSTPAREDTDEPPSKRAAPSIPGTSFSVPPINLSPMLSAAKAAPKPPPAPKPVRRFRMPKRPVSRASLMKKLQNKARLTAMNNPYSFSKSNSRFKF